MSHIALEGRYLTVGQIFRQFEEEKGKTSNIRLNDTVL